MATPKRLRPRKTPVQERSARTRERILDAAARVFAENGYVAGTTNRIAEAANLSVGSLYQYFPNKDAILVELVNAHVEEGRATLQRLLQDATVLPGDLDGRIRVFVRAAFEAHRGDAALHRVLFEESPRPQRLLQRLHDLEADTVDAVARLLAAQPDVDVPDVRLAAWMVVTVIESTVHRSLTSDVHGATPSALEDELVRLVRGFLQPDGRQAADRTSTSA